VTILHAETEVEMERTRSWKAISSGQALTIREIQDPDGRDDDIEGPELPLLVLALND
jgi:hypothetical protein